jgi:hypothetical protein
MPKIVVTHPVVDTEQWLKEKAERAASLARYATDVTDYVAADGSNNVAITADIHDMAGLMAEITSSSPESVARKKSHGVLTPQTAYIEK